MGLKELIPAFAAKLGIEGLAAEDGVCALEIDGIPLQLAEMPDGKALVATAVVGTPPPEQTAAFLSPFGDSRVNKANNRSTFQLLNRGQQWH